MEIPVRKFHHSSSCLIPSHGRAGAKVHRSRPALSLSPKIGVLAVSSTRRNEISNAWIASQPELTKKRLFLFICSVIGSGGRACHGAIRPQHRTFGPGGGQGWLFDCHSRAVHNLHWGSVIRRPHQWSAICIRGSWIAEPRDGSYRHQRRHHSDQSCLHLLGGNNLGTCSYSR